MKKVLFLLITQVIIIYHIDLKHSLLLNLLLVSEYFCNVCYGQQLKSRINFKFFTLFCNIILQNLETSIIYMKHIKIL